MDNIAVGEDALCNATIANHCICLGVRAGEQIVAEDYQFCFTTQGKSPVEFRATMSPEEYEVVYNVIKRALLKGTIGKNIMTDSFKLKLLLSCLRITCRYFTADEDVCGLSELGDFDTCHIACNCDGDIDQCDLPDKFQAALV